MGSPTVMCRWPAARKAANNRLSLVAKLTQCISTGSKRSLAPWVERFASGFCSIGASRLPLKTEWLWSRCKTDASNRDMSLKDIDSNHSVPLYVRSGVPNGSVLCPLLFLAYINNTVSVGLRDVSIPLFCR